GGTAAVRVRAANAAGADIVALKAGPAPPARPDTPPVLLNALRAKLNGTLGQAGPEPARPAPVATRAPVRPAPVARPAVTPARTSAGATGYYIQVAAVADAARARSVAQAVGGSMSLANGLYRVRFGPFDDLRTAQAARDEVAGRGYGDARIVRQD
ncbi:MAG: SPOR domain-containing protein, partial [Pseudomonadota bacterium]